MVLATITASLANFLKLPDSDASLLDVMGEGDEQHNVEDDKVAATEARGEMSGSNTPSTINDARVPLPTASSSSSSSRPPPKKQVAESWDDDDEEEEADGHDLVASRDKDENHGRRVFDNDDDDDDFDEDDDSEDDDSENENDNKADRSIEDLEQGFKNIYTAFSKLRVEFDTKFRAIFA